MSSLNENEKLLKINDDDDDKVYWPSNQSTILEKESDRIETKKNVKYIIKLSFVINFLLLIIKLYIVYKTHSLAIFGALIDSVVDNIAQLIIFFAERGSHIRDTTNYPTGKSRLEPIAIIVCSTIMFTAALQLIFASAEQLIEYNDEIYVHKS